MIRGDTGEQMSSRVGGQVMGISKETRRVAVNVNKLERRPTLELRAMYIYIPIGIQQQQKPATIIPIQIGARFTGSH